METKQLNTLCEKYRKILSSYAYKFTKDQDEINDLIQETLLRALKYIDELVDNPKVVSWLYVIMKNTYINQYRTKKQQYSYTAFQQAENNDCGFSEPFVHMHMDKYLLLEQIRHSLNRFPDDHALLFQEYLKGFKYQELSLQFNIPEGTVKSRIYSIKKSLQSEFQAAYCN